MLTLPVDDPLRQSNIFFTSALVKVTFGRCFEAAWPLVDHLRNGANIFEIQTVAADPVYAHVAYHKHSELTLAFGFCAHEPGQHFCIFGVSFNDCHRLDGSLPFAYFRAV